MTPAPTQADLTAMNRAIELAKIAAKQGETPVGAVIYKTSTGHQLAEAYNLRETNKDPCAHAELLVIQRASKELGDWRLNDYTLVVTLEPCPMCAGAIVNARIGRLIYGADDSKAGACRSLFSLTTDPRLNHRVELVAGVQAERCGGLLTEFFRDLRARNKDS